MKCKCSRKCKHGHVRWQYNQHNPDWGKCANCDKRVASENQHTVIHEVGCPIYISILVKI